MYGVKLRFSGTTVLLIQLVVVIECRYMKLSCALHCAQCTAKIVGVVCVFSLWTAAGMCMWWVIIIQYVFHCFSRHS